MARILITGSGGFLGSHTYREFLKLGHDVYGVDIVNSSTTDAVADISDWILNQGKTIKFDAIYHFAAFIKGRNSIETMYVEQMKNISIDTSVINYAVTNADKLVFISSSAVYPIIDQQTKGTLLSESLIDFNTLTIGVPDHIYGWTKLTAERLIHEISKNSSLSVIVFRPFSGYGPGQTLDYPFPNLMHMVKTSPNDLKVWGNGSQSRDFVFVDDVVRCFTWALQTSCHYDVINIGSGIPLSFNELISIMHQKIYGSPPKAITKLLSKPMGALYRTADVTKLTSLGLYPQVSIDEGIDRLCRMTV